MWATHNPTKFPNLCRLHPNYAAMETAYKGRSSAEPTEEDLTLTELLGAIEDSYIEMDENE